MNRRSFLETSIGVAVAASLPSAAFAAEHKIEKIGVQLYTVRSTMKTDFEGTLEKVASAGYKEVEFAGYFDHSPKDVRAILDKNGLVAPSCHVSYDIVENHLDEQIEASHSIGHTYIVCPWIDEKQREAADGWQKAAELFNKAGEKTAKAGIQFAYHNHTFEFQSMKSLGGKLPFDYFLTTCDPKNVQMEMDLCWISVAGKDPVAYFNKYPGRFPLVHVKDIKPLPKGAEGPTEHPDKNISFLTEVGSGTINWKRIFANSGKAGIKHYFVEHDNPSDAFSSIAKSYKYLAELRF
jgi:sugar phosphate isomerase/epimerase